MVVKKAFPLTSLKPLYSMGLCEAVMIIAPSYLCLRTENKTVGVGKISPSITLIPRFYNSLIIIFLISGPLSRPSRPIKIVGFSFPDSSLVK